MPDLTTEQRFVDLMQEVQKDLSDGKISLIEAIQLVIKLIAIINSFLHTAAVSRVPVSGK